MPHDVDDRAEATQTEVSLVNFLLHIAIPVGSQFIPYGFSYIVYQLLATNMQTFDNLSIEAKTLDESYMYSDFPNSQL